MVGASDIAVIVRGTHTCMSTRGVSSSAPTVTSCMEGDFFFDINSRNEVLELFKRGRI
jgi:GTP cyclohydrolase I